MKSIRIGNDIRFNWTITRNGEAEDFAGRTLSVLLLDSTGKPAVCHCTTEGNVIKGVFFGKDQHKVGPYRLVMHENLGLDGMSATDFNMAFCLVPMSVMEGGEDEDGIETEDINLESEITAPKTGLSAYEVAVANGYEGTEREWLESLIGESIYEMMVRTGRFVGTEEEFLQEYQDTVNACRQAAIYAKQEGDKVQPFLDNAEDQMMNWGLQEQLRDSAENARRDAEMQRELMEADRDSAERQRKAEETARQSSEANREEAEAIRRYNETQREQSFESVIVEGVGKLNDLGRRVDSLQSYCDDFADDIADLQNASTGMQRDINKKNPRLVQGSNITLTNNADGTQTISATGGDVIHVNWNDRFNESIKAAVIIVDNVVGDPSSDIVRIIPNTETTEGWLYCWGWETWRITRDFDNAAYKGHTYEDWSWGDFINWAEDNASVIATMDSVFGYFEPLKKRTVYIDMPIATGWQVASRQSGYMEQIYFDHQERYDEFYRRIFGHNRGGMATAKADIDSLRDREIILNPFPVTEYAGGQEAYTISGMRLQGEYSEENDAYSIYFIRTAVGSTDVFIIDQM